MIRARLFKLATERVLFDFEGKVAGWTRATDNPRGKDGFETEAGGCTDFGRCLKVLTANLTGWNTHAFPRQENLFSTGQELLCFWARGDVRTPQMVVEMDEADGSRWMAVVTLATRWTYHVLCPDLLSPPQATDASARG
jgi:hypothetical protein